MTKWDVYISKKAGISGIQSKHIVSQLEKQNIDPAVIDWHTLGNESQDFGDRYNTIWRKLGMEYGVSKPQTSSSISLKEKRYESQREKNPDMEAFGNDFQFSLCMERHKSRTKKAIKMDNEIAAKHTYHISDKKGVKKWMKHPNMYDIIGIDSPLFNVVTKNKKKKKRKR